MGGYNMLSLEYCFPTVAVARAYPWHYPEQLGSMVRELPPQLPVYLLAQQQGLLEPPILCFGGGYNSPWRDHSNPNWQASDWCRAGF